jgi:peptidyl-tRNA hydrolase
MSTKLVIIVRRDIRMRRAEMVATAAKASFSFLVDNNESKSDNELQLKLTPDESAWLFGNSKSIILGVQSESALRSIMLQAELDGLTVCPQYRGMRLDESKSDYCYEQLVCVAIGPHDEEAIDAITSNLKLI